MTGASRRIGRSVSLRLAHEGFRIAVHHRSSSNEARELVAELAGLGVPAAPFAADLTDPAAVLALAAAVEGHFGRVDVLVNNASVFHASPLEDTPPERLASWCDTFHFLHVRAPALLVRALLPGMRRRGEGRVISLGDARGGARRAGFAPYAASKAALRELTRVLAAELAPGIAVNLVSPGAVLPPPGASPEEAARITDGVPAGRAGTPEEVAEAVAFFARAPLFVTGQELAVAGGE